MNKILIIILPCVLCFTMTEALSANQPGIYFKNTSGDNTCLSADSVNPTTKKQIILNVDNNKSAIASYANLGVKPGDNISIYISGYNKPCSEISGNNPQVFGTYKLTINSDESGKSSTMSCTTGNCNKSISFDNYTPGGPAGFPTYTLNPAG